MMKLFDNKDMLLNAIVVVFIIVFLLQIFGKLELSNMLNNPVCGVVFLLLLCYVGDQEIVVALLLAMVYVLMNKGKGIQEGFDGHASGSGSDKVVSESGNASGSEVVSESGNASGSSDVVSGSGNEGDDKSSEANDFMNSIGGGDKDILKLDSIMEKMNSLGGVPKNSGLETFTTRDGSRPKSVQNKIDTIRHNLGKIQSTISSLKQTPSSLN